MKRKTTIKELEEDRNYWRAFTICVICVLLVFVLVVGLIPSSSWKYRELKTQLSECQDEKCEIYKSLYQSLGCNLKFDESSYNRALNEWEINCMYYSYKIKELCQEQVPVWTLKVECQHDVLGNPTYQYIETNYTDYILYQEVKSKFNSKFENCEVIE